MVVVDLSAHLFRAYHAIRPLSSPAGEPTHAVYGVVTMLERLVKDMRPTRLAIALDSGRATFRTEIFPDYKANRPSPPEDLIVQLRRASEVVRAFTPHVWQKPGFEADDLIATAVTRARAQGLRSLIVGADKDLMQLCGPDVQLWDTMRDRVIGPPEVMEKFGVRVDQLGDLLALTGDSSDNIPGVPGIGPKTAAELLVAWENLDGIYAHLAEIPRKRIRELLVENEPLARLSRRLVELDTNCDDSINPSETHWTGRDTTRLHALYTELGFTRFAASLGALAQAQGTLSLGVAPTLSVEPQSQVSATIDPIGATQSVVQIIDSVESLRQWFSAEVPPSSLSLAIATANAELSHSPIVALALARSDDPSGLAVAFPLQVEELGLVGLSLSAVLHMVTNHLESAGRGLRVHGAKQAWMMLCVAGFERLVIEFDTELAHYLLEPEHSHTLDSLAQQLEAKSPRVGPKPERKGTAPSQPTAGALQKLARDANLIARLTEQLAPRMVDEGLEPLYRDVELPLAKVLARMQLRGVLVDTSRLSEMSLEMDAEMSRLELEATNAANHPFNLNSPRQLEVILFDEIGLKPVRRTKTSRSTDAATLEALAEDHPLPRIVLQHRQVAKLKSTYVDALPQLVNKSTGRVHSSWEQTVAATGRLSSTDPNLQNIPIRTSLGRSIRKAFVAPPGMQLVSADYSQIELRILAHLSQDAELLNAYQTGQDVHRRTAAAVFDLDEALVSNEMRRQAKAVNFGVIYGQGESGLATALGITRQQAGEFIAAYYRKYRGVRQFMNTTLEHARHVKAVQSLLGRRRHFNDIDSANRALRLSSERMAMNMPIQATAADVLKLAMLKLDAPVTKGASMVMTVHDELVFEVPIEEVALAKERIAEIMQNAIQLSVPLLVDVGAGVNWADAH